jgi:hypothetical protein
MFRDAAAKLVDYTSGEQNWPRYALSMHAIELTLKGFAKHCEMHRTPRGKQPGNHDLQGWYNLAMQYGLKNEPRIAENIGILSELHSAHFPRYPMHRSAPVPDLSVITDETVEYLISTVTEVVNPR